METPLDESAVVARAIQIAEAGFATAGVTPSFYKDKDWWHFCLKFSIPLSPLIDSGQHDSLARDMLHQLVSLALTHPDLGHPANRLSMLLDQLLSFAHPSYQARIHSFLPPTCADALAIVDEINEDRRWRLETSLY